MKSTVYSTLLTYTDYFAAYNTVQHVAEMITTLATIISYTFRKHLQQKLSKHLNKKTYYISLYFDVLIFTRVRLVGDNVNYNDGVAEERQRNHSHLVHAFGSLAIEQTVSFDHLDSSSRPPFYEIDASMYILNESDWVHIRDDYVELIARVAGRIIPCFPHKDKHIVGPYTHLLSQKNKVVPLPLLFRNEQKYSDVVEILEYYEGVLIYIILSFCYFVLECLKILCSINTHLWPEHVFYWF